MILDLKLCQAAQKIKNLILIDLSFPGQKFPEFKINYGNRYICLPGRSAFAGEYAAGIASSGKIVLIYGGANLELADKNLNVKLIKTDEFAAWGPLEKQILEFGAGVLLIPKED